MSQIRFNGFDFGVNASIFADGGMGARRAAFAGGGSPAQQTWDSGNKSTDIVLSDGDRQMTLTGTLTSRAYATGETYLVGTSTRKTYIEFTITDDTNANTSVGFGEDLQVAIPNSIGFRFDDEGFGMQVAGNIRQDNVVVTTLDAFTDGDVVGIAVDFGSDVDGRYWFRLNGTWMEGDPATPTGGNTIAAVAHGLVLKPAGSVNGAIDKGIMRINADLLTPAPAGYTVHGV